MSKGINKVIIVGNLGQDPEVRFMPNGEAVANFTVATSEAWKDKKSGEQKRKTEWHRIVIYKRLAEIAGEYLKKGSKVYLEGKLKTRKWQNQQGQDQYTTEIVANEMQMLDSRGQGQGGFQSSAPQQDGYQQQAAPRQPAQQQNYQHPAQQPAQQQSYQQPAQTSTQCGAQSGYQQQPAQQGGFQQQNQSNVKVNPQEPKIDFDDDIPF